MMEKVTGSCFSHFCFNSNAQSRGGSMCALLYPIFCVTEPTSGFSDTLPVKEMRKYQCL